MLPAASEAPLHFFARMYLENAPVSHNGSDYFASQYINRRNENFNWQTLLVIQNASNLKTSGDSTIDERNPPAPPRIIPYPILRLHTDGVLPYREVNNFYIMFPTLNTFIPMYIDRILDHFIPFITALILMFKITILMNPSASTNCDVK